MKKSLLAASFVLLSAALFTAGCDMDHGNHEMGMHDMNDMHAGMWAGVTHAVAVLQPTDGNSAVSGWVKFDAMEDHVHVTGEIKGLAPNSKHGFHIHEFGDASAKDGMAAGGHYNPEGGEHHHGDLNGGMSHAGDLGNVTADATGTATIDIMAMGISIAGMKDPIIGRAVVLHANPDDLTSQPAGNSGPRIAVGVIGIRKNP